MIDVFEIELNFMGQQTKFKTIIVQSSPIQLSDHGFLPLRKILRITERNIPRATYILASYYQRPCQV